jgi:WD40 repeat protein
MPVNSPAVLAGLYFLIAVSAGQCVLAEEQNVDALEVKTVTTITSPGESFDLIAMSPDGKLVATVSGISSKSVELWDAMTGKQLGSLPNAKDSVTCVAFTADNKTMITGDYDGIVSVWDVGTRKLRKSFKATLDIVKDLGSMIPALAVSADGKIAYIGEIDHAPGIWDIAKAKRMVKDRETKGSPSAFNLAPKSQILVSASPDLQFWDAKTAKERATVSLEGGAVRTLQFSPDEKLLAVGHDLGLLLVDVSSRKVTVLDEINGHPAVAFSKDGKTLVGFRHSEIGAWNVASGKKQSATEIQRESGLEKSAISADGTIVAIPFTDTKLQVFEIPAMKSTK